MIIERAIVVNGAKDPLTTLDPVERLDLILDNIGHFSTEQPQTLINSLAESSNGIKCPHRWVYFYKGLQYLAKVLNIRDWEVYLTPERRHTNKFGLFFTSEPIKVVELGPGNVTGDYKGCVVILKPGTNSLNCDFTNSVVRTPDGEQPPLNIKNCTLKNTTLILGTSIDNIIFPDNPGSFGIIPLKSGEGPVYPHGLKALLEFPNSPRIDLRLAWRTIRLSTDMGPNEENPSPITQDELASIEENIKTNRWRVTDDHKRQLGITSGKATEVRYRNSGMDEAQLCNALDSLIRLGQTHDNDNTTLRIRWHRDSTPAHYHGFVFERFNDDTFIVYFHDLERFYGLEVRNVYLVSGGRGSSNTQPVESTINERSVQTHGTKQEREWNRGATPRDIFSELTAIFLNPSLNVDISWCSNSTKRPTWTRPIGLAELFQQMENYDTLQSLEEEAQTAMLSDFIKSFHQNFEIRENADGKLTASKLPTS